MRVLPAPGDLFGRNGKVFPNLTDSEKQLPQLPADAAYIYYI